MRSLHPAEAGIALALALTLAVKIALLPSVAPAETPAEEKGPVVAFLEHQGFAVGGPLPNNDPVMLSATKAGCSLRFAEVSPIGWHRDVLARLAAPGEQVAFVYGGNVFATQPVWKTFFDHSWRRLLAYAGLHAPEQPVLGIIASPGCSLRELPWGELAGLG
jgi:hypothetical protein